MSQLQPPKGSTPTSRLLLEGLTLMVELSKYILWFNIEWLVWALIYYPLVQLVCLANKFWSGLLEDYYLPRASTYFDHLRKSLQDNEIFRIDVWRKDWISYSNKWQSDTKIYPVKGRGDALSIATRMYQKYFS